MKNLSRLGFVFFICIVVPLLSMAQSVQTNTFIQGVVNFDDQYEAVLNFPESKAEDNNMIVPISKSGNFAFKFPLQKWSFVKLTIIPKARNQQLALNFPLYLQPGSKTSMQLNYNDTSYLTLKANNLSGSNKALVLYSNYRYQKMKYWYMYPPKTDEVKTAMMQYFDQVKKLDAKYKIGSTAVRNYLQAWAMNDYIDNLTSQSARNKEMKLDQLVFDIPLSPAVVYNKPQALMLSETFRCLDEYVRVMNTSNIEEINPAKKTASKMNFVKKQFTNEAIKNLFYERELAEYIRKFRITDKTNFEADQNTFNKLADFISSTEKKNELINQFSNLQYTLAGASLPPIHLKDRNGNEVALSNFKGKNIYIDLWASWCIPCIQEIPNLHQLEEEYKDKNIVFLSISIDEDKTAWQNKMKELKLEGHQLETGASGFEKMMNVQGIPHFILYDSDGKLLHYKAPRPGTQEIRNIFNSLK
ncbi:MAG: TlpA family protein disulfide reductase [Chitinophagaceae bacterium]|nr:MAG: TlpA family protein disulfide reductase [Chitinophagaceae bacterium]